MKKRSPLWRITVLVTLAGSLALSGCSGVGGVQEVKSTAEQPSGADGSGVNEGPPEQTVPQICSQVSVLVGIQNRYQADETQGLITTEEMLAVTRTVTDGFVYLVSMSKTVIHSEIEALRKVARDNPDGGPDVDVALGDVLVACAANGATIEVMARPGQGG